MPSGAPVYGAVAASAETDVEVLRQFFSEGDGVPDSIIDNASCAGFVGYVQGRFV